MAIKDPMCKMFRFSGRGQFFVAWIASVSFWVFFAVLAVSRNQLDQIVFFFLWSGFWLFLTGGAYRAIITSDVLVDEVGVSRKLFGRVIQGIRWSELKLIREYSGYVRNAEETLRFVRLVPKAFPFFTFRLCEPMLISDRVDDFEELIATLNKYIAAYRLYVEIKVNGQWQPGTKLVTSP